MVIQKCTKFWLTNEFGKRQWRTQSKAKREEVGFEPTMLNDGYSKVHQVLVTKWVTQASMQNPFEREVTINPVQDLIVTYHTHGFRTPEAIYSTVTLFARLRG